jgi:hypothetical protein
LSATASSDPASPELATVVTCCGSLAHRLGGSHAQHDVLHLTLLHAIERIRRPAHRLRRAFLPIAAQA